MASDQHQNRLESLGVEPSNVSSKSPGEGFREQIRSFIRNLRDRISLLLPSDSKPIETLSDPALSHPSVGLNNLAAEMGTDPGEIISLTEGVFSDLVYDPDGLQREVLAYLDDHPQVTAEIEKALSGLGTLSSQEAQGVDAALDTEIPAEIQRLIPEIQRAVTSPASPSVLMRLAKKLARIPTLVPATLAASVGAYFGLGAHTALASSPPPPPDTSEFDRALAESIRQAGGGAGAGGAGPVSPTPGGGGAADGGIFPDLPDWKKFIPDWGDITHLPDKLGDLGTVAALLGSDFVLQRFVPRLTAILMKVSPVKVPPSTLPFLVYLAGWLGYGNSCGDAILPGNGNVLQYYFLLSLLQVLGRGATSLAQKGAGTGIAQKTGTAISGKFPRVAAGATTGTKWTGKGLTWADRFVWLIKAVLAGKGFMGADSGSSMDCLPSWLRFP